MGEVGAAVHAVTSHTADSSRASIAMEPEYMPRCRRQFKAGIWGGCVHGRERLPGNGRICLR